MGKRKSKWNRSWAMALIALGLWFFAMGCATTRKGPDFEYRRSIARFHFESDRGAVAQLPVSNARIQLNPKVAVSEFEIADVQVVEVEYGKCLASGVGQ